MKKLANSPVTQFNAQWRVSCKHLRLTYPTLNRAILDRKAAACWPNELLHVQPHLRAASRIARPMLLPGQDGLHSVADGARFLQGISLSKQCSLIVNKMASTKIPHQRALHVRVPRHRLSTSRMVLQRLPRTDGNHLERPVKHPTKLPGLSTGTVLSFDRPKKLVQQRQSQPLEVSSSWSRCHAEYNSCQ